MNAEQLVTIGGGLVVIGGGIAAYFRWFLPVYRRGRSDIVAGRDALLGRDEIRDSITGKVLAPALPGMGIRMDRNEEQGRRQEEQMTAVVAALAPIGPALAALADTQAQLAETNRWRAQTEKRLEAHEKQIDTNARDIADLRVARMDRVAGHIESAAAWSAIEAVAKQEPDAPVQRGGPE